MKKGRIESSQSLKNTNSLFKVQILIVDDDSTSLAIVSSMLKTCSLQDHLLELSVVTVKNGLEALSTIQAKKDEQFDLVITDLHLPGINGWQLQKLIDEKFKIPVITVSSDDRESVIAKSLESGALFHIVKPVSNQDLKNIWQCAVANKKGKAIMRKNNNNNSKDKNIVEEEIASSNNNEEMSSASSVNEENSNNKNNKKKGKKRARGDDDHDDEDVVAPKKAKVVWTNSLHNRFLQAINHIGLEKAVPKRILEFMNVPGLTRENVASHLQKYRMFLKKVAERGLWSSQAMSERILRSSFATGYNSNLINKNNFQFPQQPLSTFQQGHRGNFSTPTSSSFGLSRFEASSSNSAPHFRLGQSSLLSGGGYSSFQRPVFGDTSRFYQPNQARYGMPMQSNNGLATATSTPQMSMYQQQQQNQVAAAGNLQNLGNPSPFFQSGNYASTSTANIMGSTSTNFLTPFNPSSSNYAGIRLNSNGELGTNNIGLSSVGYGSTNWTNNVATAGKDNIANINNALSGNIGLFGYNNNNNNMPNQGIGFNSLTPPPPAAAFGNSLLGQGGSSSSTIFGTGNNQLPTMPFNVGNQASSSMLTPNTNAAGFENSGGSSNDFAFNLINDVANSDDNQVELQDSDLELFFGAGSTTTPYQQQGVGGALNIESSSYPPELNPNEFLNVEFSNSCTILDKSPNWNGQSSQQGAETANLGSDGNSTDDYFPSFDQPQHNDEPMGSEVNGMDREIGTSDENQGWEEDFLDILLGNNSYLTEN